MFFIFNQILPEQAKYPLGWERTGAVAFQNSILLQKQSLQLNLQNILMMNQTGWNSSPSISTGLYQQNQIVNSPYTSQVSNLQGVQKRRTQSRAMLKQEN